MSRTSSTSAVLRARKSRLGMLFVSFALAACGGGGSGDDEAPPASGAAPAPAPVPAPAPAPSPAPAPAPASGPLTPLTGAADAFPHAAAPLAAAALMTGSAQRGDSLSRDKSVTYNLTLNNTNGVQTVLQVPGGAFFDDVFLTTTEVTAVGSAVTSVVAAVRIDPGELLAEVPITATFVVPDAMMATLDRNELVGFVADPDGSNLHLVPIVAGRFGLNAARPAVKLDHLGIVGIALASPSQQAALAAAWPADTGDQLAAAIAPGVTAQWRTATAAAQGTRSRALASNESPFLAPLRGYFNDVVVPAFAAAYGDPAQIPSAIQTGFSFLRGAALTGLSEPGGDLYDVAADLSARMDALLDRYADYVADQCRTIGGPPQLQAMLSTIRLMQLQGREAKAAELSDALPQCSRFNAKFTHDFRRKGKWDVSAMTNVDMHTVMEGETNFGFNAADRLTQMRFTTVENNSTSEDGKARISWALDNSTSTWAIANLTVPVVRTRGGTPSTSFQLAIHAFAAFPLTVSETTYRADGTSFTTPGATPLISLSVPAFPWIESAFYGPVLVPQSGSITSTASRTKSYSNGRTAVETERATLTITKAN